MLSIVDALLIPCTAVHCTVCSVFPNQQIVIWAINTHGIWFIWRFLDYYFFLFDCRHVSIINSWKGTSILVFLNILILNIEHEMHYNSNGTEWEQTTKKPKKMDRLIDSGFIFKSWLLVNFTCKRSRRIVFGNTVPISTKNSFFFVMFQHKNLESAQVQISNVSIELDTRIP